MVAKKKLRGSRQQQRKPARNNNGLKAKSKFRGVPANYVQSLLYEANGYRYYASYCCNYQSPHWGIIVSGSKLNAVGCPNGCLDEGFATPRPQKFQLNVMTGKGGSGASYPSNMFLAQADGPLYSDSTVTSPIKWNTGLTYVAQVGNCTLSGHTFFSGKMYNLTIFWLMANTVGPCPLSTVSFPFAIADKSTTTIIGTPPNYGVTGPVLGSTAHTPRLIGGFINHTITNQVQYPLLAISI